MDTLPSVAHPETPAILPPELGLGDELEVHAEGYRLLVVDQSLDAAADIAPGLVALRDPATGELFLVSLRALARPAGAHLIRKAGEHIAAALLAGR